jgi:hypothetical protein
MPLASVLVAKKAMHSSMRPSMGKKCSLCSERVRPQDVRGHIARRRDAPPWRANRGT